MADLSPFTNIRFMALCMLRGIELGSMAISSSWSTCLLRFSMRPTIHSSMPLAAGGRSSPVGRLYQFSLSPQAKELRTYEVWAEVCSWMRTSARRTMIMPGPVWTKYGSMSSSPTTLSSRVPQPGPRKWRTMSFAQANSLSHLGASASVSSGGSSDASPVSISTPGVRPTRVKPRSSVSGSRSSPICETRRSAKRSVGPSQASGSTSGVLSSQILAAPRSPSSPSATNLGGCCKRSASSIALMSPSTPLANESPTSWPTTAKPLLARACAMAGPATWSGCPGYTS
mmetsp:Transcript_12096/g.34226  ORF Transcript_12096/g.34226 Transcript_12096/m.34226 type:complete len:285 (+) Transcript_12096:2632-3486(+)